MPTVTSTPGVYIEEDASPAISVSQGATAVPLFITPLTAIDAGSLDVIIRVSSWLSFTQLFSAGTDKKQATAYQAIRLYFQNGGGACYVLALKDEKAGALNTLLAQIEAVGEITLFSAPYNVAAFRKIVYEALAPLLNKNQGYFLLADSADGKVPAGIDESSHAAVYYPTLLPVGDNAEAVMPSALMAAVYCKTDRERGVWKAPANVVLSGISDVSVRVTDNAQGAMNKLGINVIRYFSGRGVVVWGARTQQNDDNWRYIPVRRLFDAAERDIKKAMRSLVFEPNHQLTWQRVQTAIENYLHSLWRQGGLSGNKASEAYFVRIGKDLTMTTDDINQGKMIVQVGMAAVRPAEFIILQFTQDMPQ
ncbi:phage tail sheath family protein [Serratia inhibens]|uniref:Phage tail sheath family protein n=1 Tax=Serratia inhibens TaxID=2338073 RepID=A0AA92X7C7_9GAMM|nr:phage tail sheath C-terminal domain-containing protein [Serratia inhibens]RJF58566.1 phage tail sheath family protein [Serratia inhibens]